MTNEQVGDLLKRYQSRLESDDCQSEKCPSDRCPRDRREALNHLLSMMPKMKGFIASGDRDKLMRWLGFQQGVFWPDGVYSLQDLRDHNRAQKECSLTRILHYILKLFCRIFRRWL